MKYIYLISAVSENTLRVLQQVAGIFARHRLNIEQLNVFETGTKGISHFSIVIHSDPKTIARAMHQLQRIVELLEVKINNKIPLTKESSDLNIYQ
ncbi:MAG: acetolactate synthase small subunit [Gammaproteobacteria bacterium]